MYLLKVNKQKYFLKTNWFELTCREYNELMKLEYKQLPEIISVLSKCPVDLLKQMNPDQVDTILPYVSFVTELFDINSLAVPKVLEIGDVKTKVPQNIELETWGQKLLIEEEIKQYEQKPLNDIMTFIAAVYLAPNYYNKKYVGLEFENKVKELEITLRDMLMVEIFPIANFFFRSSMKSLEKNLNNLQVNLNKIL